MGRGIQKRIGFGQDGFKVDFDRLAQGFGEGGFDRRKFSLEIAEPAIVNSDSGRFARKLEQSPLLTQQHLCTAKLDVGNDPLPQFC